MTTTVATDSLDLQQVKAHLNIDFSSDDVLLQTYIDTSLEYVQSFLERSTLEITYTSNDIPTKENNLEYTATKPTYVMIAWGAAATGSTVSFSKTFSSSFAVQNGNVAALHNIPYGEISDFITYLSGAANTFDHAQQNVAIDTYAILAKAVSIYDPSMEPEDVKSFTIESMDIPASPNLINQARTLLVGDWYSNREDTQYYQANRISHGVRAILNVLKSSQL